MTLHVLGHDESIAVAPGGRVRIVAPDHASTSGGDGGRDAADRIERLHGYVVRGEVTAAPALIARGLVEGTTWEDLHADLVSLGDDDDGDDGDGDDDDADLSSAARWLLRRPSHGGCFVAAVLDARGTFRLRTDTLGRCPVLMRDFGGGVWILGSTPGGDAPHVRDGWRCHHPRHVLAIDPIAGVLDPTCTVRGDARSRATRRLPLIPPNVEPCTSATDALLAFRGSAFEPDAPTGAPTGRIEPADAEGVLTVGDDPEWDEGMDAASDRLARGLVAAVHHVATHHRCTRERPLGVLFSGGVDSTALLAVAVRIGIPVVAATAGWTGEGTKEPLDISPARAAAAMLGARFELEDVSDIREVIDALRALHRAVHGMDVVKAGVALPVYFAARALARTRCAAALAGGGSEEVMCGYARHSARPRDAQNLGLSGLRSLHHRDLQRDSATTTMHGLPTYQPFLSGLVVEFAQNLPTRLKLKPGDVEKRVLRVALEGPLLRVPRSLTRRPKLAAQYGSRFNVALQKLGKVLGLGARGVSSDAVAACETLPDDFSFERRPDGGMARGAAIVPPPPPPAWALLYTSGHNSAATYHTSVLQRRRFVCVVPFAPPTDDEIVTCEADEDAAFLRRCASRFAHAVGLPLWAPGVPRYTRRVARDAGVSGDSGVRGDSDSIYAPPASVATDFAAALHRLREEYPALEGLIVGHVHDMHALLAAEEACDSAGLRCIAPGWGQPQSGEILLKCRGGATEMLVTKGARRGEVLADPSALKALVADNGGYLGVDGDARGGPVDMIPARAEFYRPDQTVKLDELL